MSRRTTRTEADLSGNPFQLSEDALLGHDRVLACQRTPDLFFADSPAALEHAKTLCTDCPIRRACLREAVARAEPWGVWGGEILTDGRIVTAKRGRGRPPKASAA